jgi:hypothetical protein
MAKRFIGRQASLHLKAAVAERGQNIVRARIARFAAGDVTNLHCNIRDLRQNHWGQNYFFSHHQLVMLEASKISMALDINKIVPR